MEIPQHAPLRFCSINEEMQTTANRCLCCVFIQKTLVYSVLSNTVFVKSKKKKNANWGSSFVFICSPSLYL